MGKLFDAIKPKYDELAKLQNDQENNYVLEVNFTNLYNAIPKASYINFFINEVSNNQEYYFKSKENFNAFIEQNREIFPGNKNEIPKALFDEKNNTGIIDVKGIEYERILDAIEEKIGEDKTKELLEKYKDFTPSTPKYNHPFSKVTTDIINKLDELNLNEIEINQYKDALNYANEELVVKRKMIDMDHLIDTVARVRDKNSKSSIIEFSNEIGADANKIESLKTNWTALAFKVNEVDDKAALGPFLENQAQYSEDFKNKILELDKFVMEKGLIPDGSVGETPFKEYGFIDYFNKAFELKGALLDYTKLVDSAERKQGLENITLKVNELKEITNKYNDVIDYIKKNFDLSKTSLNENIYSGRVQDSKNNLQEFFPNLPQRWDYENAGFGVILNGYAQLKGAAKMSGVSLEEYIENPSKSLLQGAKNLIKDQDEIYVIPRKDIEGNDISLGSRIARIAVMDDGAYFDDLDRYRKTTRGMEFLNNVSNYDENTSKNIISSAAAQSLIYSFDHSSGTLFFKNDKPDYESIQNLFALGNDTDNLLALSKNYFHENLFRPDLDEPYKLKIKVMKDVHPVNETRRVMNVLKDYMAERVRLYVERRNDNSTDKSLEDQIDPSVMFVAAKKYMNDYIYDNKIDLLAYNKEQRKEVMDFLNDPIQAFVTKYEDVPNLLRTNSEGKLLESFDTIDRAYKKEFDKLYKKAGDSFVNAFNDLNTQTKGKNTGKTISQILEDNKGGFLERKFGSSSKEYKALVKSVEAATDPVSRSYGDLSGVRVYAQKYIDHKLPQGASFEKLSKNEQRRVEFCYTLIGACTQMELNQKMEDSNIKLAPDNDKFQENLKNDVDLGVENNNIVVEENEIVKENVITQ